jgi:iron complex transport system substrate-binding protein
MPRRVSQRARFVLLDPTEDAMRMISPRPATLFARPATAVAAAALAAVLAACSGSPSSAPQAGASRSASAAASNSAAAASSRAATEASAFPATVRGANGPVRLPARPSAIVSLSPTLTEMLYAIGAGGQVTAVDQYSTYPTQAPRTSLSGLNPNVEAIAGRRPDLVVLDSDRGGLTKRLAAFHIPVLVLPAAASLSDVYHEIDELGVATGHPSQAQAEVAGIRADLARIVASTPRPATARTYYYELEQDYYSVTSATFVGQLLSLLGLRSIADRASGAAANGGYPQLSAEYIIKSNPDYIFLADTVCCKQTAATVAARPGWSGISAVTAHRIVPLNDDIASRWGPRVVDLVRAVSAALRAG